MVILVLGGSEESMDERITSSFAYLKELKQEGFWVVTGFWSEVVYLIKKLLSLGVDPRKIRYSFSYDTVSNLTESLEILLGLLDEDDSEKILISSSLWHIARVKYLVDRMESLTDRVTYNIDAEAELSYAVVAYLIYICGYKVLSCVSKYTRREKYLHEYLCPNVQYVEELLLYPPNVERTEEL